MSEKFDISTFLETRDLNDTPPFNRDPRDTKSHTNSHAKASAYTPCPGAARAVRRVVRYTWSHGYSCAAHVTTGGGAGCALVSCPLYLAAGLLARAAPRATHATTGIEFAPSATTKHARSILR